MNFRHWKLSGLVYNPRKLPEIEITAYGKQVVFSGVVQNEPLDSTAMQVDNSVWLCDFQLRLPSHTDPDWSESVYFCPIKITVLSGFLTIGNLYSNYAPATNNKDIIKLRSWSDNNNQFKEFPKINGTDILTDGATGDMWHKVKKDDVLEFIIRNHTNNVVNTYSYDYYNDK
jgi:hypothetical protein